MFLVFDTETTGLPLWKEPSDHPGQPHIVDIACSLFDRTGLEVERFDALINPGVPIPDEVSAIHGITTEMVEAEGIAPSDAFAAFNGLIQRADVVVGHNVSFDLRMVRILGARVTGEKWESPVADFCTMRRTTNICKIPSAKPRYADDWKWPRLTEAYRVLFGEELAEAHRARPDCDASARIFFHLKEQGTY